MSIESNNLREFEGFVIDLKKRVLWFEDERVDLTPKVVETLCVLVERPGELLSKDELIDRLWEDTFVEERNLTQNIFILRKMFEEKKGKKGRKLIETIPKRGYRFAADLQPVNIEEESIEITHTRQTQITAEGFVSRSELKQLVKEIAGTMSSESGMKSVQTDKEDRINEIKDIKGGRIFPAVSNTIFAGAVFIMLVGGYFFLFHQDDLAVFGEGASTKKFSAANLEFARLTDSGKAYFPTLSPDKQSVAYVALVQNKWAIHLQNIATGSKTVVVEPSENLISGPTFSKDGNFIYYRQDEKTGSAGLVYRVPIFGGTSRVIVTNIISGFSLSPDGEWLSFIRSKPEIKAQQLIICRSSDGSGEKVISTRKENESFIVWDFEPQWSPDGKNILVGLHTEAKPEKNKKKESAFGMINIADGSFNPLKFPRWNFFKQVVWMPDGESLLFIAREKANEHFQIWQVSYPDGEARQITNDSINYNYLSVARDGNFILTTQKKTFSNLWLIPLLNPDDAKQLTFTSEIIYGEKGISWTPDGKELVFTLVENNLDSNIWVMNIETLEKKQLTFDENKLNWFPKVTPDGRSVIFSSNRENGWHIWQMNLDGSDLRQIRDGIGENWSNITADGNWLIFATPGIAVKTIWKKSLKTEEEPVLLFNDAAGENSISPDNKYLIVSYTTKGEDGKLDYKYGLMPFEPNGKPQDLGFSPIISFNNWKADSSGFYWLDRGINSNNVWFYSIIDKSKKQITNFDKMRMSQMSLSPDGKTLAAASGETVSNIFKIHGF